jgi:CRISPR-associated protein Cas6/Cse3/CasE subtype I-E
MYRFVYINEGIDSQDIYRQHQQVWKDFSDAEYCPKFRIDGATVTVVSGRGPTQSLSCSMTRIPTYKDGDVLKFKWRGCVEKKRSKTGGKSTVVPITDFNGICAWADRVSQESGFKITEYDSVSAPYPSFGFKKEQRIVSNTVDFEGTLTVTNAEIFNETVRVGAGTAKLGFGMVYIKS